MEGYEREYIAGVDTAHELLKAVYQNPLIPLAVRMRAAMSAIPFEAPKLMAVAQVNERDFATLLDQRIERHKREQRLLENKPIPEPEPEIIEPEPKAPSPNPLSRIYSSRFRRRI
jgi:hypothetical protein